METQAGSTQWHPPPSPTHLFSYLQYSCPTTTKNMNSPSDRSQSRPIYVVLVVCLSLPPHLLRLGTPNSVLTDFVVFLFFLYLILLTYDSHAIPMLLLSFHIMPHALLTSFISVQCMAMFFFPSLPFCHRRAVASCFTSFPFHGRA